MRGGDSSALPQTTDSGEHHAEEVSVSGTASGLDLEDPLASNLWAEKFSFIEAGRSFPPSTAGLMAGGYASARQPLGLGHLVCAVSRGKCVA